MRLLTILFLSFICCSISAAYADLSNKTENVWLTDALQLQREIDINAPLNEATFLGTHNSYNSAKYKIPLIRYIDPNQTLSIYEQLDAGVRSIELDVHWTINKKLRREILLCHGRPHHLGCSPFDLPVAKALQELRNWLKTHPNEIVLLYFECYLDGHEDILAAKLKEYLGEYIFKPNNIKKMNNTHSCVALPMKLSKADILSVGKQILIVSKGCDHNPEFNDYVFAGMDSIFPAPFTFIDSMIARFIPYPDCGKSTIHRLDPNHTSLWRISEDRTITTRIGERKKLKWVKDQDMRELMRCGINWPSIDMLKFFDPRLKAGIWSWTENYPEKDGGNCAIYKYDKGIQNSHCDKIIPGFTCKDDVTHTLKAIPLAGSFVDGEKSCQLYAGHHWHFAVPVNGLQLNTLKESMESQSIKEIWLNYSRNQQGHWIANHSTNERN